MMREDPLQKFNSYETTDLKLAALLLSEIPGSNAEVFSKNNSFKKTIRINYLPTHKGDIDRLSCEFIDHRAKVDVYRYNKNLNLLRDKLKK